MNLYFLTIIISFFSISSELPNIVEIKVPPPMSKYSDWYDIFYKSSSLIPLFRSREKTYFIGKYFRVTFLQAHLFCNTMHMNLLTISSEEENEELRVHLYKHNISGDFWTSGTRMLDGRSWIWMSTAKSIDYKNWGPGQPNNKNDHCILATKIWRHFIWNDRNCNCRFFFICEKSMDENVFYSPKITVPKIRKYYGSYFD